MVKLVIKNLKEVETPFQQELENYIKEKFVFFENLFKKYDKDLKLEVIINKSAKTYTISAAINLKSKKVLLAEENKDVMKAAGKLMNEFKRAVKRQYELEKKEYEYKRKR